MEKIKIGVFLGSFRKRSLSRQIATIITSFMPAEFEMQLIEFGDLDIYHQDWENENQIPAWILFREQVKALDGFLFVTPEYNRSFPPALKKALEIGCKSYDNSIWGGKPGAIISVSPDKIGGFGANHRLRQCMVYLNIYLMQQPETCLGSVNSLVDAQGMPKDRASKEFLKQIADSFSQWIIRFT